MGVGLQEHHKENVSREGSRKDLKTCAMRQTEGEMFLAGEVASAKALGWTLAIQQRVSVFVVKGGRREEDM